MSSRPLAALASTVLAVLMFVFLLPEFASACSCGIEGSQKERAKDAISDSEAVFSGGVVDFEKTVAATAASLPATQTVSFRVSEVWKGPRQQTVQFTTPVADGISCAHPFKEGQEYLIYANGGQQGLEVGGCSETKLLSEAGADLTLLGNSEKPKGGDEALTDTSGGVSARAIAGMAGLLMAASLLLVVRLVRTG